MLLDIKYYDYLDSKTKERTLSQKGAFDLIYILDDYKSMIDAGLNSYDDKIFFIKQYFEKGD